MCPWHLCLTTCVHGLMCCCRAFTFVGQTRNLADRRADLRHKYILRSSWRRHTHRHFAHPPLIFTGGAKSPQFGLDFRPQVAFDALCFENEATAWNLQQWLGVSLIGLRSQTLDMVRFIQLREVGATKSDPKNGRRKFVESAITGALKCGSRKCRGGKCRSRQQRWKMQEWKIQER